MKKNLFISIVTLAVLAMPMFSSCSNDDDNTTFAVKALYKNTWYWVGFALDGEYTQVGNGVGEPLYSVSFSEGRVEGKIPVHSFASDDAKISGN